LQINTIMNVSDEKCSRCGAGVTEEEGVYCGKCREEVLIQYSAWGGNIGNMDTEEMGRSKRDEEGDGKKEVQEERKEAEEADKKQMVTAEQVKGGMKETGEVKSAEIDTTMTADQGTSSTQGEKGTKEDAKREQSTTSTTRPAGLEGQPSDHQ